MARAGVVASAVLLCATQASATACPDSTNPLMSTVTDLSPQCFELCPQVCAPLDGLITEYMASFDTEALKDKICANPEPFRCFFAGDNMRACRSVLEAGSYLGIELPMSDDALSSRCGEQTTEPPATERPTSTTVKEVKSTAAPKATTLASEVETTAAPQVETTAAEGAETTKERVATTVSNSAASTSAASSQTSEASTSRAVHHDVTTAPAPPELSGAGGYPAGVAAASLLVVLACQ